MKNIMSVISLLVLLIVLFLSCSKQEDKKAATNDYLPLTIGAKYKYNYLATYVYSTESSTQKGECIWTFISKTVDTTVVYKIEQSFKGYYVYRYYTGRTDSSQIENQISTLSFEVLNDVQVAFTFRMPYWGDSRVIFERFIQSDKIDTCFTLNIPVNRGCLRKNIGITNLGYYECGNHCSSVIYSLIEGPYY